MWTNFASSTVRGTVGSAAIFAAGFLSTIIVARLLGPDAVGVVAYVAVISALALALLDLGIPGALMRFLPELEAQGQRATADSLGAWLFRLYVCASVLACLFAYFIIDRAIVRVPYHPAAGELAVVLVCLGMLVQSISLFYFGYLRGSQQFSAFAKTSLTASAAQTAAAAVGSSLFGVLGALASPLFGFFLPAISSLTLLRREPRLAPDLRPRVLRFAFQTWVLYVLTTIAWSRIEIYFLQYSWGSVEAGLFAVSLNVANLAFQLPLFLTTALVPYLAATVTTGSPAELARSYSRALRYFAIIAFPACLGAAALAPVLVPAVFGSAFSAAGLPAAVLSAGCITMTLSVIVQAFALAREAIRALVVLAAVGALISILSGFTLIPAYGAEGAAVGRVIAQAAVAAGMLAHATAMGLHTPWGDLVKILMAATLCAAAAFLISIVLQGIAGVVLAVALGACLYGLLIGEMRILSRTELRAVVGLLGTVPAPGVVRFLLLRWFLRSRPAH